MRFELTPQGLEDLNATINTKEASGHTGSRTQSFSLQGRRIPVMLVAQPSGYRAVTELRALESNQPKEGNEASDLTRSLARDFYYTTHKVKKSTCFLVRKQRAPSYLNQPDLEPTPFFLVKP